ncbi:hypothetical protein KC366_g71 [Hortaea werneckii]|nr:hypothetical protein KC366_g71 [Hortaea werneckii]
MAHRFFNVHLVPILSVCAPDPINAVLYLFRHVRNERLHPVSELKIFNQSFVDGQNCVGLFHKPLDSAMKGCAGDM